MQIKLDGGFPVLKLPLLVAENEIELADSAAAFLNLQTGGHDFDFSNPLQVEQDQPLEVAADTVRSFSRLSIQEFVKLFAAEIESCGFQRLIDPCCGNAAVDEALGRQQPGQISNGL